MKTLIRRNLSEVFKTEKASKNLKSKKGHESNVSCVREGRLYRLGNYNFMRFYMQGSDKKNLHRVSEVMTLTLTDQCLGMTSDYMQMVCTNCNGKLLLEKEEPSSWQCMNSCRPWTRLIYKDSLFLFPWKQHKPAEFVSTVQPLSLLYKNVLMYQTV